MSPALTPKPVAPEITAAPLIPSVTPKDGGSGLELDTGYQSPASVHPSVVPRPSSVPSVAGVPQIPSLAEEEPLDFEPEELEELAKYGSPPANIFASVSYAMRVRRRSSELKEKAKDFEPGLNHSKSELIEELARLGERARVGGYSSKMVTPLLAQVEAADRSAASAKDANASELKRHLTKMEELEARLEEVGRQIEKPRQQERSLSSQLAAQEEKRRHIEMRLKRAEIEIRNAEDLVARAHQPAGEGANPKDHEKVVEETATAQSSLPSLQDDRQKLRSENALLEDPITDLRETITKVRAEVDSFKKLRTELSSSRDEEEALHKSNKEGISSQSDQAQNKAKTTLAEIGRFIRYDRNAPGWAQELYPSIDQRAIGYLKLWEDHQRCVQAAEAFDHGAVKRGYIVMASGAGLFGLGFVALIAILSID